MHFWGEYEIFDRLDSEACTEAYRETAIRNEREGQILIWKGEETCRWKLYTDGAARGNPDGPGGYGAIWSMWIRKAYCIRKNFRRVCADDE